MGRRSIIAMFFAVMCLSSAAQAASAHRAAVELLLGSVVLLNGNAVGITEPRALVLIGIGVIAFSWFVRRKISRMRR